jgi:predicted negative regulator of RcsB-dependent stress response
MDIYASDDEKAEAIKQWWRDNGRTVVFAAVISALAVFGGRYWVVYQKQMSEQAAQTYHQVLNLLSEEKTAEADTYTQKLLSDFTGTPYSVFAAFDMASVSVANGDQATAKTYLQWIVENAELRGHEQLAVLRLANLLVNEGSYDEALAKIEQSDSVAFSSLFAELKGDIFVQQAKLADAKTAYLDAIAEVAASEPRFTLLKMKLDDLS